MRRQIGAVALEFLMLFPFVVAMLYAAAIYGIVFFSQYRLQNVVDRSVSTALYVDRSAYAASDLQNQVESRARAVLLGLLQQQPEPLKSMSPGEDACGVETIGGVEMLRCTLTYNYKAKPIVPVMSFGMLGTFPPLPDTLTAEAHAAF
ncbi:TadE/TadG family type IV pilus assembly protein [Alloalcanivorax sp. C16-2]|uniref:TadE/TadG family type IV pilus assembly protein n=1 Tax=Alloalcanivorax sp. C16-2 TaxID=3390052 RepID=UPI0039711189